MDKYAFRQYDFKDKDKALFNLIGEMFKITLNMFKWVGLPSSIPQRELEMLLQMRGSCIIASHNSNLYALGGNLGGECDAYYIPKYYIVANPWLKLNKTFERDVDCVFGTNDSMWTGLVPMMERYGTMSLEADLSIWVANIMERLHTLIRCADDSEKVAFETLLKRLSDGELASAIVSDDWALGDGVGALPFADNGRNSITQLIELRQYVKAGWFNSIGLQANYNMKREAINSIEGQLNEDGLVPMVADMLQCRIKFADSINDMFGTDISVELDGAWKARESEIDATIEQFEQIAEGVDNVENNDTESVGDNTGRDISEDGSADRGRDTLDRE